MKLSEFKFDLPENLIAQTPPRNRDDARMMVVDTRTGEIEHREFREIVTFLSDGDLMVMNDTSVFPARMTATKEKTGADIDVQLLRELNAESKMWDVIVEPARKIRIGNKLFFGESGQIVAEVIDNTTSRGRTLRFLYDGDAADFRRDLYALGHTPLPEYIKRPADETDQERYQTIYADPKKVGAIVAPAAGMHITREILKRLEIRGVNMGFLTMHSGMGAFREIDVEDLNKHRMDSDQLDVSPELVQLVNTTKDHGKQVCAMGTSVLRGLATAASLGGHIKVYQGWTNKFIFPPYDFTVTTQLCTNLHMPYSTMLMMTAAFGGYDLIMRAYKVAIKEKYRFGCYGDAMLILK